MKQKLVIGILSIAFLVFLSAAAFSATVTIQGTVTDAYTIESSDGNVYDVADTDEGNALLEHVGKQVQVTGDVDDDDVLVVKSFKVMEE
jgi:hypothetical protein